MTLSRSEQRRLTVATYDLLAEHDQINVAVEWGAAKRRFGAYIAVPVPSAWRELSAGEFGGFTDRQRKIRLSAPLLGLNPDKAEDTIAHEVAHAIAGVKAEHGRLWVRACDLTGADPSPVHAGVSVPFRWGAYCAQCDKVVAQRHRVAASLRNGARHPGCGAVITWIDQMGR
jgi:hypothetical protein